MTRSALRAHQGRSRPPRALCTALTALLLGAGWATPGSGEPAAPPSATSATDTGSAAQDPPVAEAAELQRLRDEIERLRVRLESLDEQRQSVQDPGELERRIDLLARELETLRTAGADGETGEPISVGGLAPAASKVYGVSQGVSLGGYGEVLFERPDSERQDGTDAGGVSQIDFLRQILYVGYKFSDRVLFNSEIEFEHAQAGEDAEGEVSVEFGYLEFQPWKPVGIRAGLLLLPVGFVNELHEPPIFHGARRPDVESAIIPSTWRENGVGVFGDAGPVSWRAYAVAGLDAAGFSASGIRSGRQSGSKSRARDWGVVARVDYTGLDGLLVGGSVYSGGSAQGALADGAPFDARLTLWEAHAQYQHRGLELRGLVARSRLGDAAQVNAANELSGRRSVGDAQSGWYVQAAWDVMTLSPHGRWSVSPFARYEKLDTQDGVPAGFADDPATDRSVLTFGVGVKPLPQVVIKADYAVHRNQARTGTNRLAVAVGYLF